MIQKPNIVSGYNFEHVLHVDNEYEYEYHNNKACHSYNIESSSNDAFHLSAAVLVKASVDDLLVLYQQVQVVLPNSRDLFLGAGHVLQVGIVTGVLHFATSLHQKILAELRKDEHTFVINFFNNHG
jgi:hypothetical protein